MKNKPMTAREKRLRAEARAHLREEGLLPPRKKPLNRKRFCREAKALLEGTESLYDLAPYLYWALCEMLERKDWPEGTVSAEAVGAAKVIKLAAARRDFERAKREAGKTGFTVGELLDAVKEVFEA